MEQAFLMAWQMMQMSQLQQQLHQQFMTSQSGQEPGNGLQSPNTYETLPAPSNHQPFGLAELPVPDARSRSRTPPAHRRPCTPEVATPEAQIPQSPDGLAAGGSMPPETPEIERRLLAIAKEDDPHMTKKKAVERLGELAQEARTRLTSSQSHDRPVEVQSGNGRQLGTPFFQPVDAQRAREAISAFNQEITKAVKGHTASAQSTMQLNVKFAEPVPSAADLAARIQGLLGAKGPVINVQPLEESSWRKPSAQTWFAEKKGDARICMYKVNVPSDSSHKKARNLSFQVSVGGRELTVKGTKGALHQFGPNIILMFGPHRCVEAAKTQAATTCLDDFWGVSR